jgi:hypothetical protein
MTVAPYRDVGANASRQTSRDPQLLTGYLAALCAAGGSLSVPLSIELLRTLPPGVVYPHRYQRGDITSRLWYWRKAKWIEITDPVLCDRGLLVGGRIQVTAKGRVKASWE